MIRIIGHISFDIFHDFSFVIGPNLENKLEAEASQLRVPIGTKLFLKWPNEKCQMIYDQ